MNEAQTATESIAPATKREPIVVVKDVHKSFNRRFVRGGYTTFKTQFTQWFKRRGYDEKLQTQKLHVLRGLNFEVAAGETIGIIGQNGAGKSTLLKLLTGIYQPSSGSVEVEGRISALLELGAGFHPEYSGRENIYMNGMILGLSRNEIAKKESEIIEFSELGDFIDSPVRTYSSGMYMRLAFSVAVNVRPHVLIIDEILAVGDEHFQRKSRAKLNEFKNHDMAIILVTHDLGTVETWCNRAIWLDKGVIAAEGDPALVVHTYREAVRARDEALLRELLPKGPIICAIEAQHPDGSRADSIRSGDDLVVVIETHSPPPEANAIVLNFFDHGGQALLSARLPLDGQRREKYLCRFEHVPLAGVELRLAVSVVNNEGSALDANSDAVKVSFFGEAGGGVVTARSVWS